MTTKAEQDSQPSSSRAMTMPEPPRAEKRNPLYGSYHDMDREKGEISRISKLLLCHLSESSRHPRFNDGKDGEPCGPREYVPWDDLVQPIIAIIDERTKDLGCLFAFLRKRYCRRRMRWV